MQSKETHPYELLSFLKRACDVLMECTLRPDYESLFFCGHLTDLIHEVPDTYLRQGRLFNEFEQDSLSPRVNHWARTPPYQQYARFLAYLFNATLLPGNLFVKPHFHLPQNETNSTPLFHPKDEAEAPVRLLRLCTHTFVMMRNRFLHMDLPDREELCRRCMVESEDLEAYLRWLHHWHCLLDSLLSEHLGGQPMEIEEKVEAFLRRCPPHLQRDFKFIAQQSFR